MKIQMNKLNLEIKKLSPRPSTKFIKKHFGDKSLLGCEVGVFYGKNSKSILKTLNMKKLVLIDPYLNYKLTEVEMNKESWRYQKSKEYFEYPQEELDNAKINAKKILKDKPVEWHDTGNDLDYVFDFIYIDGDHEYSEVKKDLERYYPLVIKGGVLCGHDFPFWDVMKAVVEFAIEHNLKVNCELNDWWLVKDYVLKREQQIS